jgi:hypothetical protein
VALGDVTCIAVLKNRYSLTSVSAGALHAMEDVTCVYTLVSVAELPAKTPDVISVAPDPSALDDRNTRTDTANPTLPAVVPVKINL